jgi:hypothetical protein
VLKRVRQKLGLTQGEVARRARRDLGEHWYQVKVSALERGATYPLNAAPNADTFLALLKAMLAGLPPDRRDEILLGVIRELAAEVAR